MKKMIMLISLSLLLAGCTINAKKNNTDEKEVENIDFQTTTLKNAYFDYVNTYDLVNMPPISEDLKNYLIDQVSNDTTKIRETVELKEKFDDKMKDVACGNLPSKLCEYNAHLYSGSYFGLKLYEKANNQELLNKSIVAAPLSMWSVTWLKNSYEKGLEVAKKCPDANNECLNKEAKNPIEKLVGLCKAGAPEQINECIGLVLNKPENKDFAFIVGYITGYNVSFNVGNSIK